MLALLESMTSVHAPMSRSGSADACLHSVQACDFSANAGGTNPRKRATASAPIRDFIRVPVPIERPLPHLRTDAIPEGHAEQDATFGRRWTQERASGDSKPIFHREARDIAEVALVVGDEGGVEAESMGGDHAIEIAAAHPAAGRDDLAIGARSVRVERYNRQILYEYAEPQSAKWRCDQITDQASL